MATCCSLSPRQQRRKSLHRPGPLTHPKYMIQLVPDYTIDPRKPWKNMDAWFSPPPDVVPRQREQTKRHAGNRFRRFDHGTGKALAQFSENGAIVLAHFHEFNL
jgi:hypothetical protein